MKPIARPDYLYYSKLDTISVNTFLNLLAYAQLSEIDDSGPDITKSQVIKNMKELMPIIKNALEFDKLDYIDKGGGIYRDSNETFFDPTLVFVDMYDLCEWAISKKFLLPKELRALVSEENSAPESDGTSHADPAEIGPDTIDLTLWNKAVELVIGERLEKHAKAEVSKSKNALLTGRSTWPYQIKAVYRTLKYIIGQCECINLAVEKSILSEMESETVDFTPEQIIASEGSKLESYDFLTNNHNVPENKAHAIKTAVNRAMSSDTNTITRIYNKSVKENGARKIIWDSKWLKKKCTVHPDSLNNTPPKKNKAKVKPLTNPSDPCPK